MQYHSRCVCELINYFVPDGIGAEIGVFQGETSRSILESTKTKHLYMVDPWMADFDTSRGLYTTKGDPGKDYREVAHFFNETFPDRSTIIRKESVNAVNEIDEQIDFVFIDANHTYEAVWQDLEVWIPKIKTGGLVMGHDWWKKFPGVIQAVTEFCQNHNPFTPPTKIASMPHYNLAPGIGEPVVMKSLKAKLWWGIKNARSVF